MRFDILASKFSDQLNTSRWAGIKSKKDSYVFIIFTILVIIFFSLYYTSNYEKNIKQKYISQKNSTFETFKNTDNFKHKGLNVLLLGGSTSRELTGSNDYLSEKISLLCGREVNFINAGTSSQSYITSRTIYSRYKEKIDLVIIGMNYFRYILPASQVPKDTLNTKLMSTIPFSVFLEEFPTSQNLPAIQPIYFLAKFNNLLKSNKISTHKKEKEKENDFQSIHNKYNLPEKSMIEKENIVKNFLLSRHSDFINYSLDGSRHWEYFSEYAKNNNSNVVFLVLPEDQSLKKITKFFSSRFNEIILKHKKKGINVIDWRYEDLNLNSKDFYDQQHLLKSGRKKIVSPLSILVSNNLPGCIK